MTFRYGPARTVAVLLSVLVAGLLVASPGASAGVPPAGSRLLFHLDDPRLDEASGIARGIRSPGVVYMQNDSGDSARFFAVSLATGRVLAVYDVPGVTNVDWEDISVATDSRGVPSIWIADIGDNDAARAEVAVYRVDEPSVPTGSPGVELSTGAAQVWRLDYPGGARDAEALAVAPGGKMTIFDKTVFGATTAYSLPAAPDPLHVRAVRPIGGFSTQDTNTPGGPNAFGTYTVTGASLSPDGSILAVRTYTDAYLWRVDGGDIAAAIARPPTLVALPAQPQGEGIAFAADRLLIDSESSGSAVWSVPQPALAARPKPAGSSTRTSARPPTSTQATDGGRPLAAHGNGVGRWPWVIGVLVLVALGGGAMYAGRHK